MGFRPLVVDLNNSEERSRFSDVHPVNLRLAGEQRTTTIKAPAGVPEYAGGAHDVTNAESIPMSIMLPAISGHLVKRQQ